MVDSSDELERLNREQLVLKARVLGVERAELMTRVELRDEIVRRSEPDLARQKRARGFLGVARDLVASVVEAGLNLPDAAAIIRGEGARDNDWKGPPPVATVTLAEIYATQGHLERALGMLDEVLAKEPDHDPARALRDRLASGSPIASPPPRRRQRISFAEPDPIVSPTETSVIPREPAPESQPAPATTPSGATDVHAPDHAAIAELHVSPAPSEPAAPEPAAPEPTPAPPAPAHSPPKPTPSVPKPAFAPGPEPAPAPGPGPGPEPAPAPAPVPAPVFAPGPGPAPAPDPAAAAAPAPALTPAPAPSVVTLSLAGQRQVYWELPASTWDALRAHSPRGRAVLRVVSFRTRAGKVERTAHDFFPRAEVGSAVLPGLRADSVVRAVLGWEVDGRLLPFVVASDLAAPATNATRLGSFRAHPLVGSVAPGVPERAQSHFERR